MQKIADTIPQTFKGKTVILRSGLNIPLDGNGVITDDLRLRRALGSIKFLQSAGAKVVVVAHIGRKPEETLRPIFKRLAEQIRQCTFSDLRVGTQELKKLIESMGEGEVLVLENIRREPRETGNDMSLAQDIASLGDMFVGDAFPDAHREQPSIVGVPQLLPHYAGIALSDEVANLNKAYTPAHPSIAFVAGSKFETKEPLIHTLLEKYDEVFVGGALANDILKARGYPIGKSVTSDGTISDDIRDSTKILIPTDVVVERATGSAIIAIADVKDNDIIVDIGPLTILMITPKILTAQFVVWNGPMGWYEKGYVEGSRALAHALAGSTATTIIGGGDTVAAINDSDINPEERFSFVSAGGGAMLEFLSYGTLPGISVLET